MKQPKRLTRNHKILLSKIGIDPKGLMLISEDKDRMKLYDTRTKSTTLILVPEVCNGRR